MFIDLNDSEESLKLLWERNMRIPFDMNLIAHFTPKGARIYSGQLVL